MKKRLLSAVLAVAMASALLIGVLDQTFYLQKLVWILKPNTQKIT